MSALPYLQKQFRELSKDPPAGFRVESEASLYTWVVWFSGPQDTPYAGGQYKAVLNFPKEFPMEPPTFQIVSSFWHPNVYHDGLVCISILHPPGEDSMNAEESAMMRWTPVQTIRSVLISIISLLSDPDPKDSGAPANVDALVQYRKDRESFTKKCAQLAAKSLRELPEGFVSPSLHERVERPATHIATMLDHDEDDDNAADFNVNVVPSVPATGPERYIEELRQLRSVDIDTTLTDEELLQLLYECRGNVDTVMERLFT